MKNNFTISIITLTKNDHTGFYRSFLSILDQNFIKKIELLILDGSEKKIFDKNATLISKKDKINYFIKNNLTIKHINIGSLGIKGIYKCMNYGLLVSEGKSIIFINGGDSLYEYDSLTKLDAYNNALNHKKVISFGQANIISKIGLSWKFPGSQLKDINLWLKYFEPNHQAMLVSSDIAKTLLFNEECKISADKFWKKEILKRADNFKYLDLPVCNFYLDGYSSIRPSIKILSTQFRDKQISLLRKFITLIKFLIIPSLYKYMPYLLKLKSKIIDCIF